MTIQIAESIQHTPPKNGFDQRDYTGVTEQQVSVSTSVSSPTTDTFVIRGDVTFLEGVQELSVRLAPALRPFANASLHVVGATFVDAVATTLQKARVIRFK